MRRAILAGTAFVLAASACSSTSTPQGLTSEVDADATTVAPSTTVAATTTEAPATTVETTTTGDFRSDGSCELDLNAEAIFDDVALEAGFLPDPYEINVGSGGCLEASELDPSCTGTIAPVPDVRLSWSGSSPQMRIFFASNTGDDAALVINDPDGDWTCIDDFEGLDPLVSYTNPSEGIYDIFVATYPDSENSDGVLFISEGPGTPNDPFGSGFGGDGIEDGGFDFLDIGTDAGFGEARLAAGFTPDPHEVAIVSGGSFNAFEAASDDCFGWIAGIPDYRVNWTGDSSSLRMFFESDELGADTTLVVLDPLGNWFCDDDSGASSFDPQLDLPDLDGEWNIWIGSFDEGELVGGMFYVTELNIDADDVG